MTQKRDPLADPMPGDVFRNKSGTTHTIVGRFVSVGKKKGAEMPGYFIRTTSPNGEIKYGSTAIVIIRFRKKSWTAIKASTRKAAGWERVDARQNGYRR